MNLLVGFTYILVCALIGGTIGVALAMVFEVLVDKWTTRRLKR